MARNRSENPVVLSRIYTRTGDDGTTALGDNSRVAKTDARLAAYADTEEANCAIGTAITFGDLPSDIAQLLARVQNELFDVGADLANPISDTPPPYPPLRVDEATSPGWRVSATPTTRRCRRCAASCCRAAVRGRRCCTRRGR